MFLNLTCCPLSLETCRLSSISHLLPMIIRSTSCEACSVNHHNMIDLFWSRSTFNVADPVLYIVEGLLVGDVVDEHDAHRSPVVGRRDRSEPLLTCRIPASWSLSNGIRISHSNIVELRFVLLLLAIISFSFFVHFLEVQILNQFSLQSEFSLLMGTKTPQIWVLFPKRC